MIQRRLAACAILGALTLGGGGCDGTVSLGGTQGDAGPDATLGGADAGSTGPQDGGGVVVPDAGSTPTFVDAGLYHGDGSYFTDAGAGQDAAPPVDAGIYHGDGSYFTDGGAFPDAPAGDGAGAGSGDGSIVDASTVDAPSSCQTLSACCASVAPSSQSLCVTVASADDGPNCTTELAQLQSEGDCTGVSVLASQVQSPPALMASDGTTLFWTTAGASPGLSAMPVAGGDIRVVIDGRINLGTAEPLLAVDDVNLYVALNSSLVRIPKSGAAPALVNEPGGTVYAATILGGTAYWADDVVGNPFNYPDGGGGLAVRSAPVLGGAATLVGQLPWDGPTPGFIGVTSSTVFLNNGGGGGTLSFPISTGVPAGGPTNLPAAATCGVVTSDTSAIYGTAQNGGANVRIASDGSIRDLGAASDAVDVSAPIAFDGTYVYWADGAEVGTIMKASKAGGGTATIIARDANPTALAVDATYVYWGDVAGYIKRVPK